MMQNRVLMIIVLLLLISGGCLPQEQAPAGPCDDIYADNGFPEMDEKRVVALAVQGVEKFWYVMGGGSGEKPLEPVIIDGLYYRYLGSDIGTQEKLLAYLQEVFTEEGSRAMIEQAGIREHQGRLIQPEASIGCILEWEKAQSTLVRETDDTKEYELKVPAAQDLVLKKFTIKNVPGSGWKIKEFSFL